MSSASRRSHPLSMPQLAMRNDSPSAHHVYIYNTPPTPPGGRPYAQRLPPGYHPAALFCARKY